MRTPLTAALVVAGLTLCAPSLGDAWTPVTPAPRLPLGPVLLGLNDGSVLQIGGENADGTLTRAFRYLPDANAWVSIGTTSVAHASACAGLTATEVVVVGGYRQAPDRGPSGAIGDVDRFRIADGTWRKGASLAVKRREAGCVAVDDRVLALGGWGDDESALSSVELYDPTKDSWATVASMPRALSRPKAVKVPGTSSVLVAGTGAVFLFDGGAWAELSSAIAGVPVLTALADGVLITTAGTTNAYVYTTAKGIEKTTSMKVQRGDHAASALADGRVVVTGGVKTGSVGLTAAEVFDPKARTWAPLPDMPIGRFQHLQTTLPDGRVFVLGGFTSTKSFLPPPLVLGRLTGTDCKVDDDCANDHCADGVCCATACDGPCERCDATRGTCTPVEGAPRHGGCGPYASCVAGACPTTCASATDCSSGNVCYPPSHTCGPARGLCDNQGSVLDPVTGARKSCAPFNCNAAGDCLGVCATSGDCAPGSVCDGSTCVTPAAGTEQGGCNTRGPATAGGGFALVVLLALGARRRRAAVRTALPLALLGCSLGGCSSTGEPIAATTQAATFSPGPPMTFSLRSMPALTRLSDGRVLVSGGSASVSLARTAELFDPALGTFAPAGTMATMRTLHAGVALPDGRAIVIGGYTGSTRVALSTTELWSAGKPGFSPGPPLTMARARVSAARLPDGRILAIAAESKGFSPGAELLDADLTAWTVAPTPTDGHFAVFALPDGRALAIGGEKVAGEILDAGATAWTPKPTKRVRFAFAATQLTDGRVVVAGGAEDPDDIKVIGGVEVYDPKTDEWTVHDGLSPASCFLTATALRDDTVLILGGSSGTIDTPTYQTYARAALFDPATGAFRATSNMLQARDLHAAVALKDGRVLVVGGFADDEGVLPELYNVPVGQPCGADGVCASGFCADGVCCATRCGSACTTCAAKGSVGACTTVSGPAPTAKEHASCAPYAWCISGACATACSGDALCDQDHVCDPKTATCSDPVATCDIDAIVDQASGARRSCAPYRCEKRGTCLQRCVSADDCSLGSACADGRCVGADAAANDGGCALGAKVGPGGAWALLLVLLARGRRARHGVP